jgi:dedicator of cytokinesis protein 3
MSEEMSARYGAVARFGVRIGRSSSMPPRLTPLQGHQVALGTLVDHVVHLCLSHHDQLRINAVQILYSMIVSEYQAAENFRAIENEVVGKLDTLFMSNSKGDETARAFFIGQLRHLFDVSQIDDRLRDRVNEFLESVDSFLDLLLSVRALPAGEEFADDRVIATVGTTPFTDRVFTDARTSSFA